MSPQFDPNAWLLRLPERARQRLRWSEQHLLVFLQHLSRFARLMRLDRPIGIWLLLWPTLWALWLASEGRPDPKVLLVFVAGTVVLRSAGCIINDFADRKIDPQVSRTAHRPLATGEVSVAEALVLFGALMLLGFGLVLTMNALTIQLAFAGAIVAIAYPFMKRIIAAPQLVLGVAFSWGVPMAFAAQLGAIPRIGWLLFLASLIWVVIYDTEYAMVDRDDDLKIGVHSTAIMFGDMDRTIIAALHGLFYLCMALVGRSGEMGPWFYGGLAISLCFAAYQHLLIRERAPAACFAAFCNNAWFGGAVFLGLLLEFIYRV